MRSCVADNVTVNEKLNAIIDDFLRGKVKLTADKKVA